MPPVPPAIREAVQRLKKRQPFRALYQGAQALLRPLGRARRRQLRGTLFIAVTGSGGKTTTKELLAAVLASRFQGTARPGSSNRTAAVLKLVARTRRHHRYSVHEVAASGPDSLDPLLWMLEPEVGVVTAVGLEHQAAFRDIEAVAREKAKLVRALPPHGLAVLNADDPRVRDMASLSAAPVVLVGRSSDATLRAERVASSWPDPLTFEAVAGDQRVPVRTQLFGEHWVPAALAALAVARHAGIPLAEAADALARVPPSPHRLSEARLDSGVTFLQDDWKAPVWSLDRSFAVLGSARAARRVLVLGQLSDHRRKTWKVYRDAVASALAAGADLVVVVGRWSHYALRAPAPAGAVHAFRTAGEADEFLDRELRAGDLVLLKATGFVDHLERLVLARQRTDVRCWRTDCGRQRFCSDCNLLHSPGP